MVVVGRLQMMCMCMRTSDWWKGSVCFVVDVILLAFRNFHILYDVINCIEPTHWKFERLRLAVKTMVKRLLLPYLLATGGYHRSCAQTHDDCTIGRRHSKSLSSLCLAGRSVHLFRCHELISKRHERLLNKWLQL